MVDYKGIIEKYRNKGIKTTEIKGIFASLREAGATREDLTKDLQESILNLFKGGRTEEKQEYYNTFLLDIIAFFSLSMLKPGSEAKEHKKTEEGCETPSEDAIYAKPEDFEDMDYDEEFLKDVGWENPDG